MSFSYPLVLYRSFPSPILTPKWITHKTVGRRGFLWHLWLARWLHHWLFKGFIRITIPPVNQLHPQQSLPDCPRLLTQLTLMSKGHSTIRNLWTGMVATRVLIWKHIFHLFLLLCNDGWEIAHTPKKIIIIFKNLHFYLFIEQNDPTFNLFVRKSMWTSTFSNWWHPLEQQ